MYKWKNKLNVIIKMLYVRITVHPPHKKKKSKSKLSIGKPGENPVNALHNHAQRMSQILKFDYKTEFPQQPGFVFFMAFIFVNKNM